MLWKANYITWWLLPLEFQNQSALGVPKCWHSNQHRSGKGHSRLCTGWPTGRGPNGDRIGDRICRKRNAKILPQRYSWGFCNDFLQSWWLVHGNNTITSLGENLWNELRPRKQKGFGSPLDAERGIERSISSSPAPEPMHSLCSHCSYHVAWEALGSPLLWVCGLLQRLPPACCSCKGDWVQLSHGLRWTLVKFFRVSENEIVASHSLTSLHSSSLP